MTLRLMEKPFYYLLAPNVPVLKPRQPVGLVEDRPAYLPVPRKAPSSLIPLTPLKSPAAIGETT